MSDPSDSPAPKPGASKPERARRKRSKRGLFLRGLVTLLPAILTLFVFVTILQFVDRYLTSPINGMIASFLEGNGLGWDVLQTMSIDPYDLEYLSEDHLPVDLRETARIEGLQSPTFQAALANWRVDHESFFRDFDKLAIDRAKLHAAIEVPPWIGPALSVLIVLTLGYFAGGFVGRGLVGSIDRTLNSIPVVKSVYPYTKQFVDFFLSEKKVEFESVVAVEYPSAGIWMIGFVTSNGLKSLNAALGSHFVAVYVPSSPVPMTGYTIFIRNDRIVPLPITVDEAIRLVVSAGVLVPPGESVEKVEASFRELEHAATRGGTPS
jgi:uncharacterized membrane protein